MEADALESTPQARSVDVNRVIAGLDTADIRRVAHFVAVAQDLHFHRAAQRLFMSQPALSHSIRKLEDSLGFKLLERSSRHVALTPGGEVLFADASERLEEFCAMIDRARAAASPARPALSVGFPGGCCASVGALVEQFAEDADAVEVDCRQDTSERLRRAVLDRDLDVAVVLRQGESDALACQPFRRYEVHCAMDQRHVLRDQEVIEYAAFAEFPLALMKSTAGTPWHTYFDRLLAERHIQPTVLLMSDLLFAIPQAMRTSGGLLPITSEYPLSGGVRRPMEPGAFVDYDLIWRADSDSPLLGDFLGLIDQVRRDESWLAA